MRSQISFCRSATNSGYGLLLVQFSSDRLPLVPPSTGQSSDRQFKWKWKCIKFGLSLLEAGEDTVDRSRSVPRTRT